MHVIDCKYIREQMLNEARERNPGNLRLVIIQVDGDNASNVYVKNKIKTCDEVGIECCVRRLDYNVDFYTLRLTILEYVKRQDITGIILQLPLPDHLKPYERELLDCIPWYKDVDGLSSESVGRLWSDLPCITPATPTGLLRLLPEDMSRQNVVIVNRSNLIGKPLIKMLLDRNATVDICHSKTNHLADHTLMGDIVITGIGKAEYLDAWEIRSYQTWIDCGINRNENGKLCGDVNLNKISDYDLAVTPVPGGVGILTTAQLMLNVIKAYELQKGKIK